MAGREGVIVADRCMNSSGDITGWVLSSTL
jgi:hypothetical protein